MKFGTLIASVVITLFSGCSLLQPGCIVQNQGTALVSGVIVAQLQCANTAVVQADVLAAFQKLNICPASDSKKGPVANAVCPAVSQLAVGFLKDNVVPATWGCTSANATAALANAITTACQKLPY